MARHQEPHIGGKGIDIACVGQTPTDTLPADVVVRKEAKLTIAGLMENAAFAISSIMRTGRQRQHGDTGYGESDSHSNPRSVIRSRLFGKRRRDKGANLNEAAGVEPAPQPFRPALPQFRGRDYNP